METKQLLDDWNLTKNQKQEIYHAMDAHVEVTIDELTGQIKEQCWNNIINELKEMKMLLMSSTLERLKNSCLK